MNETKPPQPTPEQLLQMLDLQIKNARDLRGNKSTEKNYTVGLVVIGFIVAGGMIALWVMMSFLESMRPSRTGNAQQTTEVR